MSRKGGVLPALALAVAALAVAVHPLMRSLENRLLDSFVKSQASGLAPDPDIVLVDIDEKSLAEMEKEARGVGLCCGSEVMAAFYPRGRCLSAPR